MNKKDGYLELLTKSYDEAVGVLLEKYGESPDDYFREKSYERFLKGEIKSITRGKYSKSTEGIECHHIDENKLPNLSNKDFILDYRPPFEYQRKGRLVYCDVVEHAILHTLIARETSLKLGINGYVYFLRPRIQEWYIDSLIPLEPKYIVASYHKAYLEKEDAIDILEKMDSIINTEWDRIEKLEQS